MLEQIFDGQNPKRRIVSMLGKNFSRIKYILFLALLLAVPVKSWAGGSISEDFDSTDRAVSQLASFWDLRTRQSFVQVTNTSAATIFIHVQIFDVAGSPTCDEVDFYDRLTPNDTHVYNLSTLVANGNEFNPLNISLDSGGYGLVVVSVVNAVGDVSVTNPVLTGNFRVIDNAGYEYRANSSGLVFNNDGFTLNEFRTFNFNTNSNLSDVIAVMVGDIGPGELEVLVAGNTATFDVNIFNAGERQISCGDVVFACSPAVAGTFTVGFDAGINDVLTATKGGTSICNNTSDTTGFVRMNLIAETAPGINDTLVTFIGLNNGTGRGSMDSMWATTNPSFGGPVSPSSGADSDDSN